MTREEAKKIILKHQFAFASMPDDVILAVNYLVKEERWIKCSDRLPDMDVDVLGTTKDYGDVVKVTRMKTYCKVTGWEWVLTDDVEGNAYNPDEIIAWMPLPEVYKESEE